MSRTTSYIPSTDSINPTAPGGVAAMLEFHRATFGDARMDGDGADGGDGGGGDSAGAEGANGDDSHGGEGLPDDPVALKAEIARLRRENASSRTNAKATAADEARTALAQEIGKALGLVTGDQAPDPAELTKQAQAAQAAARTAQVELAVYRAATTHQGDPNALLDSRAFLAKVADLDPAAADFQTKVSDAIKAAVTENPKLKVAPVAGASSVDHAGGTGENANKPTTLAGAVNAHYGTT